MKTISSTPFVPPANAARPAITTTMVARGLKELYLDLVAEPLPDTFATLIARMAKPSDMRG